MRVTPLEHPEVLLIEPAVFADARGFFMETFHADKFASQGLPTCFVQDNHSRSVRGVLRGLHYQLHHPQGKLVRVVSGEVFDVAVDIRKGSPMFGKWVGAILSEDNQRQLYVPPGFAHGFCVVSPEAHVLYKTSAPYNSKTEMGFRFDDPEIGIKWPVDKPVVSERDQKSPYFYELRWS